MDSGLQTVDRSHRISGSREILAARTIAWWPCLALLILTLYGAFCFYHAARCATGSDATGYLNSAHLLEEGKTFFPLRVIEGLPIGTDEVTSLTYMPLGLKAVDDQRLVPGYPVGLSLLIAGTARIGSWSTVLRDVAVLHLVAGLVVVYFLAREFKLSRPFSVLCAAIIGSSPLYLLMGLQPMSDVPALVWCGATLLLVRIGQRNPHILVFAGFTFAFAVLIRPTNLLLAAPIAVMLFPSWRHALIFIAGGIPGAVFQLLYNLNTYGSPLGNGYIGAAESFSPKWIGASLAAYAHWPILLFTPIVLLGLALPWLSLPVRWKWLLVAWAAPFFGLYGFYFYTSQTWWYQRFVLPAMPALVIASLLVATALVRRLGRKARAITLCVSLAMLAVYQIFWIRDFHALGPARSSEPYFQAHRWLNGHAAEKPIALCMEASGSIFAYTPLPIVRWDWLTPGAWDSLRQTAAANHQPIYAVLAEYEVSDAQRLAPGKWEHVADFGAVDIYALH
ncbi:MAG TPA: hypothetical protein VFT72_17395 [Opitutaceae bacterium]|nr:hypothetical protein [Opitutaceae bacterium]